MEYFSDVWMKDPFVCAYWGGRPTEDSMFTTAWAGDSNWNDSYWQHERFNKLLKEARRERNEELRREMYVEMQRICRDEGGVIVYMFKNHVMAGSKKIKFAKIAGTFSGDGYKTSERWWFESYIRASSAYEACSEQSSPIGGLLALIKFFDLVNFYNIFYAAYQPASRKPGLRHYSMMVGILGDYMYSIQSNPALCLRAPGCHALRKFLRHPASGSRCIPALCGQLGDRLGQTVFKSNEHPC